MKHAMSLPATITNVLLTLTVAALGVGCSNEAEQSTKEESYMIQPPESVGAYTRSAKPEIYDRESIFDYIDGAGEVYNAYDFRKVEVWRYQNPDSAEIVAEVFDMGKPEDAYGVFTYARQEEQEGLGQTYERRGGTTCFWQSRWFVCVATYERDDDARHAVDRIAREIDQDLPQGGTVPALVQALPDSGLVGNSIRFFHLHSVLNYHYYLARENILNLSEQTDAVLAEYEYPEGLALLIRYPDTASAEEAYRSFVTAYLEGENTSPQRDEDGQWLAHRRHGRFIMIVFSVPDQDMAGRLMNRLSEAAVRTQTEESQR